MERIRVFVTGGSGFIGHHLIKRLIQEGVYIGVLIDADGLGNLNSLGTCLNRINLFQGDLRNKTQIEGLINQFSPQIVFHLGAVVNLERSYQIARICLETNIMGTLNLLESVKDIGLKRFIFCSTAEVYGMGSIPYKENQNLQPTSPYAISKVCGEMLCDYYSKLYKIPVVSLRLSTVYGPGQNESRFIPQVIISCLKKTSLRLSSCTQKRDFIYVDDLIEAFIKTMKEDRVIGEIINIGNDKMYSLRYIVEEIKKMTNSSREPEFNYYPDRPLEAKEWLSCIDKAKKILNWSPKVDIKQGLEYTINFYSEKLREGINV